MAALFFGIGCGLLADAQPPQPAVVASALDYDPAIFQKTIPKDQLAGLSHFAGMRSGDAMKDKPFRKLMRGVLPDCIFHYGSDMPLTDAFEMALDHSRQPAELRDGRYLTISGQNGPYLSGRAFLWIDLQEGIAIGGFYFHPTNGEPTPTVSIFSRQVKERFLSMGQLPPAFGDALYAWTGSSSIPPITTRYFLTGTNRRILLEHDEDFCAPSSSGPGLPKDVCEPMNAEAADLDLNAAYYLEQVHYATNATAWMITGDQIAWVQIRNNACGVGPNPLGCRIVMTRERTRVIIGRHPAPPVHR